MSSRQTFSESEKLCLQDLIIKFKINSAVTKAAGNPTAKKLAWARLVEEYNSIESNSKRTEAQLRKCWDNLKTRKKALIAHEKKERMRTGGGPFHPRLESSQKDPILIEEALVEQTDVELQYVIDSDNLQQDSKVSHCIDPKQTNVLEPGLQLQHHEPEPNTEGDNHGQSGSRHTYYSAGGQQTSAKNMRAMVIKNEFQLRKDNYTRTMEREEELHRLMLEEKQWLVKVAKEQFVTAEIKRKTAEEMLRCSQMKREEAELRLNKLK